MSIVMPVNTTSHQLWVALMQGTPLPSVVITTKKFEMTLYGVSITSMTTRPGPLQEFTLDVEGTGMDFGRGILYTGAGNTP